MKIHNNMNRLPAHTELRHQAETRLCTNTLEVYLPRSAEETQRLLHELEVHKIELEMQNTELLQARDNMEKTLEKYTDLYDFAPLGYVTLDGNGDISAVNLRGASILGGERSQSIGMSFLLFIPETSRPSFSEFLGKVLTNSIKESCEVEILQNGKQPLFVQIDAMATASGQEFRLALIDISERKNFDTHLIQAEKMETVILLAGGIARDIDNILNVIAGYGSFSEMNMKKDDPLRVNLDQIIAAADRGANLTRNLLNFSRMQPINLQPVDINEIIKKIHSFLKMVIGENIRLETVCCEEALLITADSGQLEQVFISLATNAQHAMPEGGRLSISTEVLNIDFEFIKLRGFGEPGKYALISVTDIGSGMDRETVRRIFEPFFTTHTRGKGKGTGLGLSIVYNTIRRHGGFINVMSEPNTGTMFKIYLPLTGSRDTDKLPDQIPRRQIGRQLMNSKEDYVRRMQAKLEEWNTEIDHLIARAGEVTTDVKNEYNDQIEALKALLAVTRQKFEDVQQIGEIAWEIVKSGIDLAWTSMEEAIESAKSRFKDR